MLLFEKIYRKDATLFMVHGLRATPKAGRDKADSRGFFYNIFFNP
jgi:hypothetical protein